MLWVEINLRCQSSMVWCEEGLDALNKIKGLIIGSCLKALYLRTLWRGELICLIAKGYPY